MSKRVVGWVGGACFTLVAIALYPVYLAHAVDPQSAHYTLDESTLGSGGLIQSSSQSYSGSSAVGDVAIGNSASGNYQIDAGSKTTNDPTLSFVINGGTSNLGNFTASGAATATATFSVSNYTSYGYVVQIVGNPPKNGDHTITPMATTDQSKPGIEQFGINLVANTEPTTVGANPDNGQFGFGKAAPNYGTADKYRYVSGETIALAPKSSGKTVYTISYLVNVASLTPGGKYTSNQTLIVTGTY